MADPGSAARQPARDRSRISTNFDRRVFDRRPRHACGSRLHPAERATGARRAAATHASIAASKTAGHNAMRILDRAAPTYWSVAVRPVSGHPSRTRPRGAGGVAHGTSRAGIRRQGLRGRAAGPSPSTAALVQAAGRFFPAHARGRRYLARARARARRDRAAEHFRRGSHVRQDPQRRAARRLHGRLRIRAARRGHRRRRARHAAAEFVAAGGNPSARRGSRWLELAGGTRSVHPLRAAARARPVDRLAGRRGGAARHSVAAAQ